MKIGYLGLPIPEPPTLAQSIVSQAFPLHIYFQSALDIGTVKRVREMLLADARFQSIDGKMLNCGNGGGRLTVDHLVAWWAYRANEIGPPNANTELDHFLNSPTIDLLAALWIYGVTTKTRVELSGGVQLTPIDEMPLSREMFDFKRLNFMRTPHELPPPQAALIKKVTVCKIVADDPNVRESSSFMVQSQLHKISFLMNVIPGVCCMPGLQTFYSVPGTPLGPVGGSGGGSLLFDMLPHRQFEFNSEYSTLLSDLALKYDALNDSVKKRIESALFRLAQAKGRRNPGDICLDLGIALEMVLLNAEHENQELPGQLSLHFRLRGSWLVGKSKAERRDIYKSLGKIYSLRSKIAHNGYSSDLSKMDYTKQQAMLSDHISIGEQIIRHLILEGTPTDWASLMLGT